MLSSYVKSKRYGLNVVLYTETTLDDYIVSGELDIIHTKSEPKVEEFIELQNKMSSEYLISVRLCCFESVEFEPIDE